VFRRSLAIGLDGSGSRPGCGVVAREDHLLLRYLSTAGAENARIVIYAHGQDIELDLASLATRTGRPVLAHELPLIIFTLDRESRMRLLSSNRDCPQLG
jgi:hypothetical protein